MLITFSSAFENDEIFNDIVVKSEQGIKISIFLVIALKLAIKGEANVHWERSRTTKDSQGRQKTHVDHFRGNEQYFNLTYLLLGETGGNIC